MVYAYAWYEMFGIMLAAGVAIFLVVRGFDLALERLLNALAARRDRMALDGEPSVTELLRGRRKGMGPRG